MQPHEWSGVLRNLRAVTAQMHRVAQAVLPHSFRNRIALSLLDLTGFHRWQQEVCGSRTAESFGDRSRVAQISRERFRTFVHKALESPRVAAHDAHLLALREQKIGDDRAGVPARP